MDRSEPHRHPPPEGNPKVTTLNQCIKCVYARGELVLKCKICGRVKIFKCSYCPIYRLTMKQMQEHIQRNHPDKIAKPQEKNDQTSDKAALNGISEQPNSSSVSCPAPDTIVKKHSAKLTEKVGIGDTDDCPDGLWTCSVKNGDDQENVRLRLLLRKRKNCPIPSDNAPNGKEISDEGAFRLPESSTVPSSADDGTEHSLNRDEHLPVREEPVTKAIAKRRRKCNHSDETPQQCSSVSSPAIDNIAKKDVTYHKNQVDKDDKKETFCQPDSSPVQTLTAAKAIQKDDLQVEDPPLVEVGAHEIVKLRRSTRRQERAITGNGSNSKDVSKERLRQSDSSSTAVADQEALMTKVRKNYELSSSRRATLRKRKDHSVDCSLCKRANKKVDRHGTLQQFNSMTIPISAADTTVNYMGAPIPWEILNVRVVLEDYRLANSRRSTLRKRNQRPVYNPTTRKNRTINKGYKNGTVLRKSRSSVASTLADDGNVNKDARKRETKLTSGNSTRRSSLRKRNRNPVYCLRRESYKKTPNVQSGCSSEPKARNKKLTQRAGKARRPLKRKTFFQNKKYAKERKHRCHYCLAKFYTRAYLTIHIRSHTNEKPYKCEYCAKAFTQPTNLNNHIRTHTGERPYICHICNKGFAQVTNLKFHKRIHDGIKPYECVTCGKKFTQVANRDSHQRAHHYLATFGIE